MTIVLNELFEFTSENILENLKFKLLVENDSINSNFWLKTIPSTCTHAKKIEIFVTSLIFEKSHVSFMV